MDKCPCTMIDLLRSVHKRNIQLVVVFIKVRSTSIDNTYSSKFMKFYMYYFCDFLKLCCFRFL